MAHEELLDRWRGLGLSWQGAYLCRDYAACDRIAREREAIAEQLSEGGGEP